MSDFNPDTCITAGQIRAMGGTIPDTVPDCAWVHRKHMKVAFEPAEAGEGLEVHLNAIITFTAPMEWVTVPIRVTGDPSEVLRILDQI